jgi:hypothetical protein
VIQDPFTTEAFDNSENPVACFEGLRSLFRDHGDDREKLCTGLTGITGITKKTVNLPQRAFDNSKKPVACVHHRGVR